MICSARVKLVLASKDVDEGALPTCKDMFKLEDAWRFLSLVTSASVSGPAIFSGEIAKIVPSVKLTLNVKSENQAPGPELSDSIAHRA